MLRYEKVSILIERRQYPQAISIYNEMISLDRAGYVYNIRAMIKLRSGDPKSAIADLDRAININPNYLEAYITRTVVNLKLNNFKGKAV
jgi:tetratricopeptide (TPR) repeat protein